MKDVITKLPQLMQEAIEVMGELHNTPPEMAIQAVLGVSCLAAMPHYDVDSVVYGVRPISEFFVAMVPTGGQKTTVYKDLTEGITRYEKQQATLLSDDIQRAQIDEAIYKKALTKYEKDHTAGLNPQMPKQPKPVESYNYRLGAGTVNGMIEQLKSQPFLGLASSEAGEFFNGHAWQDKSGGKAIEMSAKLTTMWDGEKITKTTGMDQTSLVGRRVSMLFLLQEATIRSFLSNPMYADQGFTHRLLITQSPVAVKPEMDLSPQGMIRIENLRARLAPFNDRIFSIINKRMNIQPDTYFDLEPRVLKMNHDAAQILSEFYNSNRERSQGDLKDYAGFGERLHEHALRLAGILAAFERKTEITRDEALAAAALMEFYIQQRMGIDLELTAKDASKVAAASKIIAWIKSKRFDDSVRKLRQFAPCGLSKMDDRQREEILREMVSTGEVELYSDVAENGREVTKIRALA